MPPRLSLLTKRWSSFDLPILPFLAPRVFQPWPFKGRSIHSAKSQAVQQKSGTIKEAHEGLLLAHDDGRERFVGSTPRVHRQTAHNKVHNSYPTGNDANYDADSFRALDFFSGGVIAGQVLGAESSGFSGEELRRKNETIWGRRSRKRLREAPRKVANHSPGPGRSENSEEEEFRRRYEEIWGSRTKKAPLMPARRVPGEQKQQGTARSVRPTAIKFTFFFSRRGFKRRPELLQRERAVQQWTEEKELLAAYNQNGFRSLLEHRSSNISDIRPKFTRHRLYVMPELYASFKSWNRRFAIISLRHEQFMKNLKLPKHGFPTKFPIRFLRDLMDEANSRGLRWKWKKFNPRRQMEIWPELMLKTLQFRPEKVLKVLAGTYFQEPFPPPYALSDCLNYAVRYFLGGTKSPSKALVRNIFNAVYGLLRTGPQDHLHISQNSTYLLISRAADADLYHLKKLYALMADLNHPMHANTLMQFADHLAKAGETDIALEILQKLKTYGSDFNTPQMLSLCSTVLNRSFRRPDATHSESAIFEHMLEWGMQPNIITYNILIKNSVDAGNKSTAWQIHDMMVESGIEPDAYTYSILLNDSKERMDSEDIKTVMGLVQRKCVTSAYIVNDVLDAIFLLYQQRAKDDALLSGPQTAFDHMLKVYAENFHIEPLARIIPWISEMLPNVQLSETPPVPLDELEYPPIPTQTLMISAFLYGLPDSGAVRQFYDHFRQLLLTGDPALADFVRTTYIWNAVLIAFDKFSDTVGDCTAVVGDMLAPTKAETVKEDFPRRASFPTDEGFEMQPKVKVSESEIKFPGQEPRIAHVPPKPDVYTWSLLVKILMKQSQTRAAEKVFTMMQERGVEPNDATWSSLAMGYIRLQDTDNAVNVLSRMERAGLGTHARYLARILEDRDRKGLLQAMRRSKNRELNSGAEFLDQLRNDLGDLRENEQFKEIEGGSNESDFIVEDLGG